MVRRGEGGGKVCLDRARSGWRIEEDYEPTRRASATSSIFYPPSSSLLESPHVPSAAIFSLATRGDAGGDVRGAWRQRGDGGLRRARAAAGAGDAGEAATTGL